MNAGFSSKNKVIRLGGHSAPRALVPEAASGGGIVIPIRQMAQAHGVKFKIELQANRTCTFRW